MRERPRVGDATVHEERGVGLWRVVNSVYVAHFFPRRCSNLPERQAASPVAPAPSTTLFSISTSLRMASAMSLSVTTTMRSTHGWAHANALAPTCRDRE